MRVKELKKKLVLKKTTIANLDDKQMSIVLGGSDTRHKCAITSIAPFVCPDLDSFDCVETA